MHSTSELHYYYYIQGNFRVNLSVFLSGLIILSRSMNPASHQEVAYTFTNLSIIHRKKISKQNFHPALPISFPSYHFDEPKELFRSMLNFIRESLYALNK